MPLWVDENRPRTFDQLDFGLEQARSLRNLVKKGDFPHLMFYGPSGAGKKTRILCLLHELYGKGVQNMRMEKMSFTTPSNRKLEILTISSNYHIEMNPSDVGIHDRVVVMDLIKQVAQTHQISTTGQREFKVIVLTGVENLTVEAQHALRRTMEKYVATCRLILVANSVSKVIAAVHSRCLCIRCAAPSDGDLARVLHKVAEDQCAGKLSDKLVDTIVRRCERNLRRAILMLECCYVETGSLNDARAEVVEPDWLVHLKQIAQMIVEKQTIENIKTIRADLYEQLIHGIPPNVVLEHLLKHIVQKTDIHLASKVFQVASLYEHRLSHGSKPIFHLEAFVAEIMNVYKEFFDENIEM